MTQKIICLVQVFVCLLIALLLANTKIKSDCLQNQVYCKSSVYIILMLSLFNNKLCVIIFLHYVYWKLQVPTFLAE